MVVVWTLSQALLPDSTTVGYFEWYFGKSDAKNILGSENVDAYNLIEPKL